MLRAFRWCSCQWKLQNAPEPIEPVTVSEGAPCQELVIDEPDLASLPIPWFFEHERGPYVTAGAIVARDPEGGAANLSIARVAADAGFHQSGKALASS